MRTPEDTSNVENKTDGQDPGSETALDTNAELGTQPEGSKGETLETSEKPDAGSKGDKAKKNIKDSFRGLKEVGSLKKQAAALESEIHDAETQYANDKTAYEKRSAIASNYGEIIATRNQAVQDAQANIAAQQANIAQFEKEYAPQKKQLDQIVKRHERELQPYKERFESAEAEYAQAEAKVESVNRSLEGARTALSQTLKQIEDATKREAAAQQKIISLNSAVSELSSKGESINTSVLQSELSVANMNLSSAQSAKTSATSMRSSAEQDVRNFENELNQAVTESSAKKNLLNSAQSDFNKIAAEQAEQQAPIRSIVEPLEREIAAARESIEASNMQLMEAQHDIDEANDINDHPEETERMKSALDALEKRIGQLKKELEELKALIAKATKAKLLIVGVIVAVIVLIVAGIAVFNAASEFAAEQERAAAIAAQEKAEAEAKAEEERKAAEEQEKEKARQEALEKGAIPITSEYFADVTSNGMSITLESIASSYDENGDEILSPDELGEALSGGVMFSYKGNRTIDLLLKNKDLKSLSFYVEPGASGSMDLSGFTQLRSLSVLGGKYNERTSGYTSNGNGISSVVLPSSGSVTSLFVGGLDKLAAVDGLEGCANLTGLNLSTVGISALDLTANTALQKVTLIDDPLSSLNVDGLVELNSLEVRGCPNLTTISAVNTPKLLPTLVQSGTTLVQ